MRLAIDGLTKRFGGLVAVDGFSATVEDRSIVGIIGPNGSGKTTVFNLISGVYKPDQGTVLLGEENLVGLEPWQISRLGICRTFQNIRLLPELTVTQNVVVGAQIHTHYDLISAFLHTGRWREAERRLRTTVPELLEFFGMADRGENKVTSLPYGQQRLVEMARAVAMKPKILLLDEPAAGMTPPEVLALGDLIPRIRERFSCAIILIEHHVDLVARVSERVIAMNYGRIVAAGAPQEVQANPIVIESYLGRRSETTC